MQDTWYKSIVHISWRKKKCRVSRDFENYCGLGPSIRPRRPLWRTRAWPALSSTPGRGPSRAQAAKSVADPSGSELICRILPFFIGNCHHKFKESQEHWRKKTCFCLKFFTLYVCFSWSSLVHMYCSIRIRIWFGKILDPDPHSFNSDPQHWPKGRKVRVLL